MKLISSSFFILFVLCIGGLDKTRLVHAQNLPENDALPCPPPGLETVVDGSNTDNCNCFYALAGLDSLDSLVLDYSLLTEDSYMHYGPAGKYFGPDGVEEYLAMLFNGTFVTETTLVGDPIPKHVKSIGPGKCEILMASHANFHVNPFYTKNNTEACSSMVVGTLSTFELTGNPEQMISVQKHEMWTPNSFATDLWALFVDTVAAAEYVCDKILNSCKDYSVQDADERRNRATRALKKSKKGATKSKTKSNKASKKGKKVHKSPEAVDMEMCIQKYNALPDITIGADGTTGFIDGNSQACRVLHSFMASKNDDHCPHITFEPEVDKNGKIKCNESAGEYHSDIFTAEEIGFMLFAGQNFFGFDETAARITYEACPAE
jgi:hypothetical protein